MIRIGSMQIVQLSYQLDVYFTFFKNRKSISFILIVKFLDLGILLSFKKNWLHSKEAVQEDAPFSTCTSSKDKAYIFDEKKLAHMERTLKWIIHFFKHVEVYENI